MLGNQNNCFFIHYLGILSIANEHMIFGHYSSRVTLEYKLSQLFDHELRIGNNSLISCQLSKDDDRPEIILNPNMTIIPLSPIYYNTTSTKDSVTTTTTTQALTSSTVVYVTVTSTVIIYATQTLVPSISHSVATNGNSETPSHTPTLFTTNDVTLLSSAYPSSYLTPSHANALFTTNDVTLLSSAYPSHSSSYLTPSHINALFTTNDVTLLSSAYPSHSSSYLTPSHINALLTTSDVTLLSSVYPSHSFSYLTTSPVLASQHDTSITPVNTIHFSSHSIIASSSSHDPVTGESLANAPSSSLMSIYISIGVVVFCALILGVVSGLVCYYSGKRHRQRHVINSTSTRQRPTSQLELTSSQVPASSASSITSIDKHSLIEENSPSSIYASSRQHDENPFSVTTFKPEAENIELQPVHNDPETTV